MNILFIGLGHMGNPMAANLIRAGYDLTVHDARRAAADNLLASGARWADRPRAAAGAAQVVITSLPGPVQVEAVLLGVDGVLVGLKPGSTWIDMSTNSAELVKQIAARAAEKGVQTLEAPVTGAVDGARAGSLSVFVGGDQAVYEQHLPIFQAMGQKIFHTGALGTGNPVKLVTNLLWFINAIAIGEGLMLGARCQVDLNTLWEAIKSSAGNSWVAEHDVPSIFRGDYDPSFSLDLCCKDLKLTAELGRQVGVPLELGTLVEQIFLRAQAQYGGDQGELHVVKLLEDKLGTRLQVADFKSAQPGPD